MPENEKQVSSFNTRDAIAETTSRNKSHTQTRTHARTHARTRTRTRTPQPPVARSPGGLPRPSLVRPRLLEAKRERGWAERWWLKSGLHVHRQIFRSANKLVNDIVHHMLKPLSTAPKPLASTTCRQLLIQHHTLSSWSSKVLTSALVYLSLWTPTALLWLFSQQLGNWSSATHQLTMVLPQGSPLLSVLYKVYTKGLADRNQTGLSRVLTLADDGLIYKTTRDIQEAAEVVQQQLENVSQWCQDSGSLINPSKHRHCGASLKTKQQAKRCQQSHLMEL